MIRAQVFASIPIATAEQQQHAELKQVAKLIDSTRARVWRKFTTICCGSWEDEEEGKKTGEPIIDSIWITKDISRSRKSVVLPIPLVEPEMREIW